MKVKYTKWAPEPKALTAGVQGGAVDKPLHGVENNVERALVEDVRAGPC